MEDALILIPARYQSSRFPNKLLAPLGDNESVIQRVVKNALDTGFEVAVVTDSSEIEQHLEGVVTVHRVDDPVASGSERIALAYQRYYAHKNFNYIINVQGDEPLLNPEDVKSLGQFHKKSSFDICTLVKERCRGEEDFFSAQVVKVAYFAKTGFCAYFSRAAIPFDREGGGSLPWYQHIGVYSYRPQALSQFLEASISPVEECEKLEQLRALELGMKIGAVVCQGRYIGVDTPEDLKRVKEVLGEQKEK